MITANSASEARALVLARLGTERPQSPFRELPSRLLVVDVERQRLYLLEEGRLVQEAVISTAIAGLGGAIGSHRTPPGWHRIEARIGAGMPPGAVFESRESTGAVWGGEPSDDDLILSRVLTLAGLEPGVNQGADRDTRARYIYLHGTNHERLLGIPASHGCVRLANRDIIELFDRVREGDPVVVLAQVPIPDPYGPGRIHYAGIAGSGMSALAQFQAMVGGCASGSDRGFDRGERSEARALLERLGIQVLPQDGTGVRHECAAVVVSTAVESQVPDVAAAVLAGVPVIHRSELLAHFVAGRRTIAITGTSGKSTVVAMVFEILRGAGRRPSLITGGDLVALQNEGLWGNACAGESDLLVIEADESDGSLIRYAPAVGVILNLQRDHREETEVAAMFAAFRARCREAVICGEQPELNALAQGGTVFGFGPGAGVRGELLELGPATSAFSVDGVRFTLPVPGRHNVENALAAIAACRAIGLSLEEMVGPLAAFQGVGRRFQLVGRVRGIEVVDDFAHNPAKLAAAIETAKRRARRVLAIFQPHGYGPTRFLWRDFVRTFGASLAGEHRLWLLEIYYAGGTATRDFSAADIVRDVAAVGVAAEFAASREALITRVVTEARDGDLVLVMGARDPSLTGLARDIVAALHDGH
ncbi:MAG: L,D-transpeptidase family protein [Candidatus Eisenbacteria bacterium]|nr:L,D-transpeptidase family protein [Candidatus Eisenbacteria bacterium]